MFGKKPAEDNPQSKDHDLAGILESGNRLNAENIRILSALAADYMKERKSKRRWAWVVRVLVLAYIGFITFAWVYKPSGEVGEAHTALVELEGLIAPSATSADDVNKSLRRAFKAKNSAGVVLRINSPGGTPVQAAKINQEIYRLRDKYPDKPFHAVISDVAASGGYYVAVASETIYAHPSSIVGSIGVRMDSFGFVDAMQKLGVERRLITSGDDKGMLDPFSPIQPDQVAHAEDMIRDVHQQFIDAVKEGRGDRLDDQEELFGGLFWSGERAMELGLVDEFASVREIARDVIGESRVVTYSPKKSLWENFAKKLGSEISTRLFDSGWRLH